MSTETYEDLRRSYVRLMVLAAITRITEQHTAGELSEFVTGLAMAEGHPKDCWAQFGPQTVLGILRQLERAGSVCVTGAKRSTRYGRDEPLWAPSKKQALAKLELPLPPERETTDRVHVALPSAAPAADVDPLESLTRDQLLAILQVRDDMEGLCEKFLGDMRELASRAQRALSTKAATNG